MRHLSVITDLRTRVAAIEGAARPRAVTPFGIEAIDRHLPGGGLGSGIVPGEPVEGIKVRTRDFR